MPRSKVKRLKKRALRLAQGKSKYLYMFSLTGAELLEIADVSRVSRDDTGKLIGYQRPEVKRHVKGIVEYLNEDDVLFPNSIILAFTSSVRFRQETGSTSRRQKESFGILEIPIRNGKGRKPPWIVDGQQRALAISKSRRKDMHIPVSAFVTDDVSLQRDQFLRVNNTKPLPRGLITELLPEVDTRLPSDLAARKVPAAICDMLNRDPESPFFCLIKRSSTPAALKKQAVITDTSVIRMVEDSMISPSGCLFPYRNLATGETDFAGVKTILFLFWHAVRDSFPDAWGKPPQSSRLMHGAGIRAMGRLMDRVMGTTNPSSRGVAGRIRRDVELMVPVCQWTSGRWKELDGIAWNEIQNVPRHVSLLSNYLVRSYLRLKSEQQ